MKKIILEVLKNYISFNLTLVCHLITSNVPQKARVPCVGHPALYHTPDTPTILSDCTLIGYNIMSLHYHRVQILYIDTRYMYSRIDYKWIIQRYTKNDKFTFFITTADNAQWYRYILYIVPFILYIYTLYYLCFILSLSNI